MAVQMHIAYSSIIRGVGVIGGVVYGCADPRQPLAKDRVALGLSCMDSSSNAAFSIDRTNEAFAAGAIDKPETYLPSEKVWLFSGNNDGVVRRAAMDAVNQYYKHYVNSGNVFYQISNPAPHALVTAKFGGRCLKFDARFINNCGYDAAGFLLKHIYGNLNQPPSKWHSSGSLKAFDQTEFVKLVDPTLIPAFIGLAASGHVYVPKVCKTETCRVHVVFHGCRQYETNVIKAVYEHAGYNEWAATNKIIVLYPQTVATPLLNPLGCWDWWGINDGLARTRDFARQTGYQTAVIKAMIDRLASGAPHSPAPPSPFGVPQKFEAVDGSTNSIALIWQASGAAQGFNIYRLSSNGQYERINSGLVSGASFADQGLTPNTTYHYKMSAVDNTGSESALTNDVPGKTAPTPPACDPYFSLNALHLAANPQRAEPLGLDVVARGSHDQMGLLATELIDETQLMRTQPNWYKVGYCQ